MIFRIITLVSIYFLSTNLAACADNKVLITVNKNTMHVLHGEHQKNYNLKHIIEGYEVNCQRTRLIAWGHPEILNKSNPQGTTLSLIDLSNRKQIRQIGYSKGVYEVSFLNDGQHAFIDTNLGAILNLSNGQSENITSNQTIDTSTFESCPYFKGKSFKSYTNH